MKHWMNNIGKELIARDVAGDTLFRAARNCLTHAIAVNRVYFSKHVSTEGIAIIDEVRGQIEALAPDSLGDQMKNLESLIDQVNLATGSSEATVPGWVAILDGLQEFIGYPVHKDSSALISAIAQAYLSVSRRACAEFEGRNGNAMYLDDEQALEAANPICRAEVAFQQAVLQIDKPRVADDPSEWLGSV